MKSENVFQKKVMKKLEKYQKLDIESITLFLSLLFLNLQVLSLVKGRMCIHPDPSRTLARRSGTSHTIFELQKKKSNIIFNKI